MADPACDKKKWKIIKDCPEDCPTQKGCNLLGVTSMVANLVSKPSPGVLLETKVKTIIITLNKTSKHSFNLQRNYTYPGKDGAVIGRDKKEECPDVKKGTVRLFLDEKKMVEM